VLKPRNKTVHQIGGSSVRNEDTEPELILRRALWKVGARGWRTHRRSLPGTPDTSFGKARIAVFVDGAFWHGHPSAFRPGRSAFWDRKITTNVERDRRVDEELRDRGWRVLRVWDFEVEQNLHEVVRRILQLL
jgi:DNA mismatch endonuclease (patch repair protein)